MSTNKMLEAIVITVEERKALTALLYSGVTGGALERMGLAGLNERLSGCFNGPWEYEEDKDKVPTLKSYNVTNNNQNIETIES